MEKNENKNKNNSSANSNRRPVRIMSEPGTEVLAKILVSLIKISEDPETRKKIIKTNDNS